MLRFVILGFCLFISIAGFTKTGISSENEFEMHVPMGNILLKPPPSVEPKRSSVEFPHSQHFDAVYCKTCHHNWNGKNPIKTCMTSECHDSNISEYNNSDSEKDLTVRYYKKAYHTQCIGCHIYLKKEIQNVENSMTSIKSSIPSVGPTGCIECHPE